MSIKLHVFVIACAFLGVFAWDVFPSADEPVGAGGAIQKILKEQQSAWNRGDVKEFLQGYWHSPELTFSGSGGITRGWDEVLARYQKTYPNAAAMGRLDFSDLEFRFLGEDSALVLGKWHLTREKDELGGVFTLVFRKFPEGWRIIHDHTSLVTPKP